MKHRLVAQLDRQIRLRGESLTVLRVIAATPRIRIKLKGIVKTNGLAQIIANITAPKYIIVVSPTAFKQRAYGSGKSPVIQMTPMIDAKGSIRDEDIPTNADSVIVRQSQLAITRVDPIYDGEVCVRIELQVSG